jgi:Uma2 family endonuclease
MRLDQPTFHALYEAMPSGVRAELIHGVVHMPSPLGVDHSDGLLPILIWLDYYAERSGRPVQVADGATVILDSRTEVQPDALLRVVEGGQTQVRGGFIVGPPELVVEVSRSTRYVDLGPKLDEYARAGVREYVVRTIGPDQLLWHLLVDGRLIEQRPGADGLYRSSTFPGLWLDPIALLHGHRAQLRTAIDRGLAAVQVQGEADAPRPDDATRRAP